MPSEAPVPTSMEAETLVLVVSALNALEPPPPPLPQAAPASLNEVEDAHCAQCPAVIDPVKTGRAAPASVVAPVPPFAIVKIQVMPVESVSPVTLVSTPEIGVPNAGPTRMGEVMVGEVASTTAPAPVATAQLLVHPEVVITPVKAGNVPQFTVRFDCT